MSADLEVQAGMETIGLHGMPLTIFINKESLATVASQRGTLARLIVKDGAHALFGKPDTELPRQTP
jgi:hypothetical protein